MEPREPCEGCKDSKYLDRHFTAGQFVRVPCAQCNWEEYKKFIAEQAKGDARE